MKGREVRRGGIKPYLPLKSNKIKEKKYESFENLKMGRNSSTKLKTLRLVDVGHFCPEFIDIDSVNTKRSQVGLRGAYHELQFWTCTPGTVRENLR